METYILSCFIDKRFCKKKTSCKKITFIFVAVVTFQRNFTSDTEEHGRTNGRTSAIAIVSTTTKLKPLKSINEKFNFTFSCRCLPAPLPVVVVFVAYILVCLFVCSFVLIFLSCSKKFSLFVVL